MTVGPCPAFVGPAMSACPDLKSEEEGALGEDRDGNNTGTRDIQPLHHRLQYKL